jgi:CRP-like cAMP-binding protein
VVLCHQPPQPGIHLKKSTPDPRQNGLIASLWDTEEHSWLPQLEAIDMPLGEILFDSGDTLKYVYFPTTAVISLMYLLENGATAETAVVGHEGIVGVSLFMGGESALNSAEVRIAGSGYRLKADILMEEFQRCGAVQHLLLRYTQALLAQMSQTAVCNRHHSVDQQLCRFLLQSLDRLQGNEIAMTQELIANSLGVRREGVTTAATCLQKAGLIRYARGQIEVLDRKGLEVRSCECYAVVRDKYAEALSGTVDDAVCPLKTDAPTADL